MSYYHDLITAKSWQFLQNLKRHYQFILIGGWAVYVYTQTLKSKDLDLIVGYEQLEKFKSQYELVKNDRLKKYEIHQGEIDVDIYVPFYSDLGLPVEDIQKMTHIVAGFVLPTPEVLLILKQKAWTERKQSQKGEKDKIDIIALLKTGLDLKKYQTLLSTYKLKNFADELWGLISTVRHVPELAINEHQYSRIKANIKNHLYPKK